jgi:hypothetical protein
VSRAGQLIGLSFLVWVVCGFPAKWIWGEGMLLQSAAALGISLIPAAALCIVAERLKSRSAELRVGVHLLGAFLRMAFVLGLGAALYKTSTVFHCTSFWLWLIGAYLFILSVEAAFMIADYAAMAKPSQTIR